VLEEKYGIVGLEPRQLGVFDDPDRDPRGWVMSVAHAATVPFRKLGPRSDLHLAPVKPGWPVRLALPKGQSTLPFDHDEIVERAIKDIRDRYAEHPDPDRLLGDTFTMRQLQDVHHAVSGEEIHKDTFRRLMSQSLEPVEGEFRRGGYGPPAQVYQREGESPSPSVQPDLWGRVAYTDEELLASVAAYLAVGGKPTAEGYRLWAKGGSAGRGLGPRAVRQLAGGPASWRPAAPRGRAPGNGPVVIALPGGSTLISRPLTASAGVVRCGTTCDVQVRACATI
jgi:ADP-ribose pyrophosphatase YjhB (NUDIX family)